MGVNEREPVDLNQIYLCHPWYWDMSFIIKYFKSLGLEIETSTIRKRCSRKDFDAHKDFGGKGKKRIWYISREQIITFAQTYRKRTNIKH